MRWYTSRSYRHIVVKPTEFKTILSMRGSTCCNTNLVDATSWAYLTIRLFKAIRACSHEGYRNRLTQRDTTDLPDGSESVDSFERISIFSTKGEVLHWTTQAAVFPHIIFVRNDNGPFTAHTWLDLQISMHGEHKDSTMHSLRHEQKSCEVQAFSHHKRLTDSESCGLTTAVRSPKHESACNDKLLQLRSPPNLFMDALSQFFYEFSRSCLLSRM